MSEFAYFQDAADYHDWWFFSGAALGGASPGETFKKLHEQLSEAGANTVIGVQFLDENERGVDPQLWRRAFVFGHVGLQVSLTLRALEAIGAVGIVQALRSSPPQPSPLSLLQEIAQSGNHDPEKAADMIKTLRENIAVGISHILGGVPDGLQGAVPQPRPVEGVETREDVQRLLDAYVAAHQADLARDVAKHGDPRKRPGFDPEAAREARARQNNRLNDLDFQRGAIDGLRGQLDKLNALAKKEAPESPRLNKMVRKVLDEYERFADKPLEDLTDDVQTWLRDVERFRDAHREALEPKASRDERVNARLAAIGSYEVSYEHNLLTVRWDAPIGPTRDWTDIGLDFNVSLEKKADPSRVDSALNALCDEYERLRARWPALRLDLKRCVIDRFGMISDQLFADERAAYEDDDGELSEEKILEAVQAGAIQLIHDFEEPVRAEIYFSVAWDEEHPIEIPLDENGEIPSWF